MNIRQKKIGIAIVAVVLLIVIITVIRSCSAPSAMTATCKTAPFETVVTSVGEIQAVKSVDILIPDAMFNREIRIWQLKITDMVAEGTKVKTGDYVATLDPGDVESELKRAVESLEQQQSKKEESCIDSSLQLTTLRSDIRNAHDQLLDKELKIEQAKYESKAYQRQVQIEFDKAKRDFDKQKRTYQQEKRRLELGIERINDDIHEFETRRNLLLSLKDGLRVKAPSDGMIIYGKSWRGNKIKVGDDVGRWMPLIATLPDLSKLVSETFVQEVDIKHIKTGQIVRINIDAFPDRKFTGKISAVANVGQKIPGKDMNGFKVTIQLDAFSEKILPGMTTNNAIVTGSWTNANIIPREALFGNDSLQFVYKIEGLSTIKQQVKTGGENETDFRIIEGLKKGDKILLQHPENKSDTELHRLTN